MSGKQHEFGDQWTCECGQQHELTDGYLAAHWRERLQHTCSCGRQHTVCVGFVKLVRERRKKHKVETVR